MGNFLLMCFFSFFNVLAEIFLFLAIRRGLIGNAVSIVSFNSILLSILSRIFDNKLLNFS
jgi:hypothetical protein